MTGPEIRAYGPNYDTDHLCVDLDKKIRDIGGTTIVVIGEDRDMRAMQAQALADSLGLKLMKNPDKVAAQHDPAAGVAVALHCVEATDAAHALVNEWVLDTATTGPRILIVEVTEGAELAVSAMGTCGVFVRVDNLDIAPAGTSVPPTGTSVISGHEDPNLYPGFTSMREFPTLMTERIGLYGPGA